MDKVDKVDFVMIEFDFGSFSRTKGGKEEKNRRITSGRRPSTYVFTRILQISVTM